MDRLTIGIDGYNLAMPNGTGVARYGYTLASLLRSSGHRTVGVFGVDVGSDPALREVLLFDQLLRSPGRRGLAAQVRVATLTNWPFSTLIAADVALTDRVDKRLADERVPAFDRIASSADLFRIAHRRFRRYGRFTKLRLQNPPAIMHWTYPIPVELEHARNIYTLHDLVPLRLPSTTLDEKRSYRALVKGCVARAARICTVSEASRFDIIDLLGADPARVTNTYQASPVPPDVLSRNPVEDADIIEGMFGLSRRGYFLYFGAIEPKKNIGRLIEAYLSLRTSTPLVLVTGRTWLEQRELSMLGNRPADLDDASRGTAGRIIRLDPLERPLLLRLIRSARAVTFPSLQEGFGLPVLEAMQLGTPVLTSDITALREVAGGAAVLVDPYDVGSIATGLRALDGDRALRDGLSRAGLVRASLFGPTPYLAALEAMYKAASAADGIAGR